VPFVPQVENDAHNDPKAELNTAKPLVARSMNKSARALRINASPIQSAEEIRLNLGFEFFIRISLWRLMQGF
jgi:hypothetical protein